MAKFESGKWYTFSRLTDFEKLSFSNERIVRELRKLIDGDELVFRVDSVEMSGKVKEISVNPTNPVNISRKLRGAAHVEYIFDGDEIKYVKEYKTGIANYSEAIEFLKTSLPGYIVKIEKGDGEPFSERVLGDFTSLFVYAEKMNKERLVTDEVSEIDAEIERLKEKRHKALAKFTD